MNWVLIVTLVYGGSGDPHKMLTDNRVSITERIRYFESEDACTRYENKVWAPKALGLYKRETARGLNVGMIAHCVHLKTGS